MTSREMDEPGAFLLLVFLCGAATHSQQQVFKWSASTAERSAILTGFPVVIHFSSHTLTFIPNTLLMSAQGWEVDEVRDWQDVK